MEMLINDSLCMNSSHSGLNWVKDLFANKPNTERCFDYFIYAPQQLSTNNRLTVLRNRDIKYSLTPITCRMFSTSAVLQAHRERDQEFTFVQIKKYIFQHETNTSSTFHLKLHSYK